MEDGVGKPVWARGQRGQDALGVGQRRAELKEGFSRDQWVPRTPIEGESDRSHDGGQATGQPAGRASGDTGMRNAEPDGSSLVVRSRSALGYLVHDELCRCISRLRCASRAVRLRSMDANSSGDANDGEGGAMK